MFENISAAVFRDGSADPHIESVSVAELRDDEVLVKIAASGICHTDITFSAGFMALPRPVVLGHEGAGTVVAVGNGVTQVSPGDAVVMSFQSCGDCLNCHDGAPSYCDHFVACNFTGRRKDGSTAMAGAGGEISSHFFGQSSFATHSVANVRNVVKVRGDAPLDLLAPLGCGIQVGAGVVFNVLSAGPGEAVAIFGAGGVGLSALMAAKVVGCSPLIIVEPNQQRRDLALELGADHVIDPTAETDIVGALQKASANRLRNAFDTTGIPGVIESAIAALSSRGKLALVTANAMDATAAIPLLHANVGGITVKGSTMGDSQPDQLIPQLVDLIMEGRFPVEKIITFYDFSELDQALADQCSGKSVKPVVRIG